MHPLHERLDNLKAEFMNRSDDAPSKLVAVCIDLLAMIEQNRSDLTNAYESQQRADHRLNQLEQHGNGYSDRQGV